MRIYLVGLILLACTLLPGTLASPVPSKKSKDKGDEVHWAFVNNIEQRREKVEYVHHPSGSYNSSRASSRYGSEAESPPRSSSGYSSNYSASSRATSPPPRPPSPIKAGYEGVTSTGTRFRVVDEDDLHSSYNRKDNF